MLYCLICSPLLIVKVIFVITVFFLFLLCVSTISVNKDDKKCKHRYKICKISFRVTIKFKISRYTINLHLLKFELTDKP